MRRKGSLSFLFCVLTISVFAQFKLYENGHDRYTAGKYDEAIALFSEYLTKVTRDKAMDVEVFYLRALSYYKKGDYQKAVFDFEESLLQNHKNTGNIHWFKAKCHEKLAQNADAIDAYTSALRELDSIPDAKGKLLVDRGRTHKKMSSFTLAIDDFKNALAVVPNQSDAKKELDSIDEKYFASRSTTGSPSVAENSTNTGRVGDKKSTPTTGDKQPVSAGVKQPDKSVAKNTVKKDAKKEVVPTNDLPKPEETTLAKNDLKKENDQQGDPSQQNQTDPDKKSIGQKVKHVAGKVSDKVGDTFRSDGKTDSQTQPNSGNTKPGTKIPANSTATNSQGNTEAAAESKPLTLAEQYKDEKRYALIIGNSAYPKSIGALRNPVNDATDLAKELTASNFEVQLLTNATYGQMRAAMLKFKDKIDAGDKEKTVSLFYFAGHGLQHEDENYLVPTDAMIEYQDDISRYCFGVQKMVLANMERSNSRMNIVILDACRNNPFPAVSRSLGEQGLGEMRRARGSFIAYATAPGSVASDGTGRNGLYTQELLKAMRKPGLTIEQVFKEVRANVLKLSADKQNTWDSSNIVGEFYFKF
jgi:Caspase domain/Tetratricopeptide repeat